MEEREVTVVPYDTRWPQLFASEVQPVRKALGDMAKATKHFGSTGVPGLAAKPIVDILVGWRRSMPPTVQHLARLESPDYEFLGEDGRRPGRYFSASARKTAST